jgi:hypothetical protein
VKRTHQLMLRTLSVVIIGLLLIPTGAAGQSPSGLAIQILQANDRENLTDKELPPMKVRVMDRTGRVIPRSQRSISSAGRRSDRTIPPGFKSDHGFYRYPGSGDGATISYQLQGR